MTDHDRRYHRRQFDRVCRAADLAEECPPRRWWSEDDDAFLRRHYARNGVVWCAVRLGRTPESVRWHAMAMRARDELRAWIKGRQI
jgi:hypothetical protein